MNLTKKIKQAKYFLIIIIASIIMYNTCNATADQTDKITLTPLGSNFCNNTGCVYSASSNFNKNTTLLNCRYNDNSVAIDYKLMRVLPTTSSDNNYMISYQDPKQELNTELLIICDNHEKYIQIPVKADDIKAYIKIYSNSFKSDAQNFTSSDTNRGINMLFDSAFDGMIIPDSCLDSSKIKTIKENVKDPWGVKSNIVSADIYLLSENNQKVLVKDMKLYANIDKDCHNGNKNFGGGIYHSIGYNNDLVTPFFYNLAIQSDYNFYIINMQNAADQNIRLTNKWPKQYQVNQLTHRSFPGTLDFKVISYNRYLPNKFAIMVGDSVFAFKSGEIDSGGGIMILADGGIGDTNDEQVSKMITALQSDNILVDCNNRSFLKGCYCIKDGETIKISNPGFEKGYTYNVSNSDYRKVALCPKNTAQTIPANFGVNPGLATFLFYSIAYDPINGRIGFKKGN